SQPSGPQTSPASYQDMTKAQLDQMIGIQAAAPQQAAQPTTPAPTNKLNSPAVNSRLTGVTKQTPANQPVNQALGKTVNAPGYHPPGGGFPSVPDGYDQTGVQSFSTGNPQDKKQAMKDAKQARAVQQAPATRGRLLAEA